MVEHYWTYKCRGSLERSTYCLAKFEIANMQNGKKYPFSISVINNLEAYSSLDCNVEFVCDLVCWTTRDRAL